MSTAEEPAANLHSMADDSAFAVFANRRNGLNRTFKTVECVPSASGNHIESLVVFVATNFACCHLPPQSIHNLNLVSYHLTPNVTGTNFMFGP